MIATGVALDDAALLDRGLDLLEWLLDLETGDGHLSPTPVGRARPRRPHGPDSTSNRSRWPAWPTRAPGRQPPTRGRPGSRACAWRPGGSAATTTSGWPMWDPVTGGGYDGLHADRVNLNQGAESTLAALSTMQQARRFTHCPAMTSTQAGLVTRSPQRLAPDPRRVITRLFVPGQEGFEHAGVPRGPGAEAHPHPRPTTKSATPCTTSLTRFAGRHRDLHATFRRHADELADRLDPDRALTESRMLLLGATFTSEYAIEGAALCNPSIVAHPDQDGTPAGSLRFVMSVRGIGEGHRSSIGFRTGVVDATGVRHHRRARPVRLDRTRRTGAAGRGRLPRRTRAGEGAAARRRTTSSPRWASCSPEPTSTSGSTACGRT